MSRHLRLALSLGLAASSWGATGAAAQHIVKIPWSLVEEVMPEADRFDEVAGDPPVVRAYEVAADGTETLIGYVFLTPDLPPEQYGYSGTIETLVGMRLDGTLTGVRVTEYHESYMSQMGDFLRRPGFQEQFAGKYIGDPFRVWGDVDGISRVSISVRALARGVRDSARRVAAAYGGAGHVALPAEPVTDIYGLSWFELRRAGVVERFEVTEPGEGSAGISLAYVGSERDGEYFFGTALYERALSSVARRGGADHLVLYAVDGGRLRLFRREGWSIAQGGDTTAIDPTDIVTLGLPSGGAVSGEATMVGIILVRHPLDILEPFTFVYDLGELGVHEVEYTTQEARILTAERAAEAAAAEERATEDAARGAAVEPPGAGAPETGEDTAATAAPTAADAAREATSDTAAGEAGDRPVDPRDAEAGGAASGSPADPAAAERALGMPLEELLAEELEELAAQEESWIDRTMAETAWPRVATMLLVLGLATWAFATKGTAARWVSLGATLVVLGFYDGGFLSVSHITSGIWAGAGVYLRDLPLLLIVVFTLVTTLVWGRVFCGFLCPFGALQDLLDRVVPAAWRRELPQRVHDRAVWLKYGILAVVVAPALVGSQISLYQYFEPFGTVFFLSTSLLFWSIALAILLASAIVPRFYCRYACPLGAALGIASTVAPRRIRRVEQCEHCKVCEQKCPTGAIRGPAIDFKECVRCNVCEVQLIEKRGVCRHDMDAIRPRLVQLERRGASVS